MERKRGKRFAGALLLLAALVLAACTSAPAPEAIPPFRQGVVTADQQTSSALGEVNRFLRRQQIERAVTQNALTEDLFVEALDRTDIAKWHRAFSLIDSYAEKLERLLAPGQRAGVQDELSALGGTIEAVSEIQLPTEISAAFVTFGGLLVQLKTERDALAAIRKADPAVQNIFSAMMQAIGDSPESGVRGTVTSSWRQILARMDVREFRPASGDAARRAVVNRYVAALDERDAQDALLSSLRLSLATLAKSHQELAQGRRASATGLIKLVQDEYKEYREQLDALRARREAAVTN
jgi:hypothetical protein